MYDYNNSLFACSESSAIENSAHCEFLIVLTKIGSLSKIKM